MSFPILKDKVIAVTGSAGLLGSALIKAIDQAGGIPVCTDTDVSLLKNFSSRFPCFSMDITKEESISSTVSEVVNKFGRIDGLINCAFPRNSDYGKSVTEQSYESFCDNISRHLGGYFLCSKVFGKQFMTQNSGVIINISSVYGVIPPRFDIYAGTNMTNPLEYGVIKSGVIHMTKYLAKYFEGKNIRVNAVSPGGIFNNQDKAFLQKYREYCLNKGMLDLGDVVGAFIFLLSDSASAINGQNLVVDDGFTL